MIWVIPAIKVIRIYGLSWQKSLNEIMQGLKILFLWKFIHSANELHAYYVLGTVLSNVILSWSWRNFLSIGK
jgi:hypothetical protein